MLVFYVRFRKVIFEVIHQLHDLKLKINVHFRKSKTVNLLDFLSQELQNCKINILNFMQRYQSTVKQKDQTQQ